MGVNISSIIQKQPTILAPDYYIYLYADENTRTQRLISRNVISPSDIALENNKELQRRIHYEFIKSPGMIHIDTSLISPEEVCDRILKILADSSLDAFNIPSKDIVSPGLGFFYYFTSYTRSRW